jgi:hypothetical protein
VAIYTQTADIETEINGYLTYDRKVEKNGLHLPAPGSPGTLPGDDRVKK